MNFDDKLYKTKQTTHVDDELDEVVVSQNVGTAMKCKILPNSDARKIKGEDGEDYVYSYVIFLRKPRTGTYPVQNDTIHIIKKDGSIDKFCKCRGFVTIKNYVKIWV